MRRRCRVYAQNCVLAAWARLAGQMGEAGFYATSLAYILCHTDASNGISAGAVGCIKSNLAHLCGHRTIPHSPGFRRPAASDIPARLRRAWQTVIKKAH